MQELKQASKQAQAWLGAYKNSSCYSLSEAYGRCSEAKRSAERKIKARMSDQGGYGYKILSYNCMQFSTGYIYKQAGTKWLVVDTRSHTYGIKVEG